MTDNEAFLIGFLTILVLAIVIVAVCVRAMK